MQRLPVTTRASSSRAISGSSLAIASKARVIALRTATRARSRSSTNERVAPCRPARPAQLLDQLVHLEACSTGALEVGTEVGIVDLGAELADPGPVAGLGHVVEDRFASRCRAGVAVAAHQRDRRDRRARVVRQLGEVADPDRRPEHDDPLADADPCMPWPTDRSVTTPTLLRRGRRSHWRASAVISHSAACRSAVACSRAALRRITRVVAMDEQVRCRRQRRDVGGQVAQCQVGGHCGLEVVDRQVDVAERERSDAERPVHRAEARDAKSDEHRACRERGPRARRPPLPPRRRRARWPHRRRRPS